MIKISREALSDMAWDYLRRMMDDELSAVPEHLEALDVEKAMFCLQLREALMNGKKRIIVDIKL